MTRTAGKSESTYWIVVADQSLGEFYFREKKNSPLQRLFTMKNNAGQKKLIDLTSDRDGRSFDSHGQGRHSLTKEKTDAKKHEAQIFANRIADRIVAANQRGEFSKLALIATPRFLGTLRKSLSVIHGIPINLSINKDVVGQDTAVIQKLLAEQTPEKT
jgi:protein required for attachment to host cells